MSYEDFVGLWSNRGRVWLQQAACVLAGQAAAGAEPLGDAWGDALADDPCQAAEIVYEANRERALARARAAGPFR